MEKNCNLDRIDKKILAVVQEDASLSTQEVADQVGLSLNPCWRRIKRLESDGIIERRVVLINPERVGLGTTVFVTIAINRHDMDWLERFSTNVCAIPEVVECHRLSGSADYLLKVMVRDIAHYDRVYQKLIKAVPGLTDVSSTFSMERLKFSTRIDIATAD